MTVKLEQTPSGDYRLTGELNMYSVHELVNALQPSLQMAGDAIRVDLGGVSRSDSAGLALLVEWLQQARARGKQLRFANLPEQLRQIAQISDLMPILPLD